MVNGKQVATAGLMVALLGLPAVTGLGVRPGQAQTTSDQWAEALRLNRLGLQRDRQGRYQEALVNYTQALAIVRSLGRRKAEGTLLNNIGAVYYKLGQYSKALEAYTQTLAILREVGDSPEEKLRQRAVEGATLNNIGQVYFSLGQYPRALEKFTQALAIWRAVGGSPEERLRQRAGEGATLNNIGQVYLSLGQYPRALEKFAQALAIRREVGDRAGEGTTLNNIGAVYRSLGQYPRALEAYTQALAIAREVGDRAGEGITLSNIGLVYDNLGQYSRALEAYAQTLAILQEVGDRAGEGTLLNNIGVVYDNLGQYSRALEAYTQALAIAQEVGDRAREGTTLNNIGLAFDNLGQYPRALEEFSKALAIRQEVGDRAGEGVTLNNIGAAYLSSGDAVAAEIPLRQAIRVWESLRPGLSDANKVALFETQKHTYRYLQQSLVAQNKIEQALEIAERGRARAFVELLASQFTGGEAPTVEPVNIAKIQQIARDQKATLVQYSVIWNEALYIWVVTPTGDITFRQVDLKAEGLVLNDAVDQGRDDAILGPSGSETALTQLVGRSRSAVTATRGRSRSFFNEGPGNQAAQRISIPREQYPELQRLHQLLIDPIQDLLPTDANDRVIFVPHQSLFLVPFVALQDESGQYLIEKHTILTAPSLQVLQLTREAAARNAARKPKDILIVGNPTMPPGWSPLPAAGKEAKALAEFFQVPFLTGDQATERAVLQRLATARIIHLATHGKADDEQPLESLLTFAPAGGDDGNLTAGELFQQFGPGSGQSLQAELVVLSACQTGLGQLSGDGVLGLSRTLFAIGAPTVIVSLWDVNDESTRLLMQAFYQAWQAQGLDKAQAMRRAMLGMLQLGTYAEPAYWSAFMVMGEAE